MNYGYMRVSSNDGSQRLDRQVDALNKWSEENNINFNELFSDKQSGKNFDRPSYQRMKSTIKEGDLIVIKSIDRLGRNYDEIITEWGYITKTIKADILVLDLPLLDTRNNDKLGLNGRFISDLVLQILSYVAETERQNIKQRQAEGIASAKARGVKLGKQLDLEKFNKAKYLYENSILTFKEISDIVGVLEDSVKYWKKTYHWKDEHRGRGKYWRAEAKRKYIIDENMFIRGLRK